MKLLHEDFYSTMDAYELAGHVEMWGKDLLSLNMKGGVPCILAAEMLKKQADEIKLLRGTNV